MEASGKLVLCWMLDDADVGDVVGSQVGDGDGDGVGLRVDSVECTVGDLDGNVVGFADGLTVGGTVG